ncbi:MAG: energy transducer TonB [Gammaproteobacteria bacterium]
MISADEALGIPRAAKSPFASVARTTLFICIGVVAALLLFLLDTVLVNRAPDTDKNAVPVKLLEFVNVAQDSEVRLKERRLPPKPDPKERPDPPKVRINQDTAAQVMEIDFEMPAVEAGLGGGQGPWLGAYRTAPGQQMHDGDIIPIVRIEPQYPRDALVRGLEGWVQVEFTILEDGSVRDVDVLDADPVGVFERNAVRAVMRWKFKPRIVDGTAVKRRGRQTIEFRLLQDQAG